MVDRKGVTFFLVIYTLPLNGVIKTTYSSYSYPISPYSKGYNDSENAISQPNSISWCVSSILNLYGVFAKKKPWQCDLLAASFETPITLRATCQVTFHHLDIMWTMYRFIEIGTNRIIHQNAQIQRGQSPVTSSLRLVGAKQISKPMLKYW